MRISCASSDTSRPGTSRILASLRTLRASECAPGRCRAACVRGRRSSSKVVCFVLRFSGNFRLRPSAERRTQGPYRTGRDTGPSSPSSSLSTVPGAAPGPDSTRKRQESDPLPHTALPRPIIVYRGIPCRVPGSCGGTSGFRRFDMIIRWHRCMINNVVIKLKSSAAGDPKGVFTSQKPWLIIECPHQSFVEADYRTVPDLVDENVPWNHESNNKLPGGETDQSQWGREGLGTCILPRDKID
eukprot:767063-Hanusia_phi.AAC.2